MTPLDRLVTIIPQDQAIANKALATSLLGITGIGSLTLPRFANAVANIQTTAGLPLISAETTAVSPAAANVILSTAGTGTGQNGTLTIDDLLGTAAGYVSANVLTNTSVTFKSMNLTGLTTVYTEMKNTVNGVYGDPVLGPVVIPSGPEAGTYANADAAFTTALIPAAQSQVGNIVSADPTQVSTLNSSWANIMSQLNTESTNQQKANLNFSQLTPNSSTSIYSFVFALPSYGQDTTVGGMAQFLQATADINTLGGQAIIATMRQGQSNLASTGISSNSQVPANPNPPLAQATLLPAQPQYP